MIFAPLAQIASRLPTDPSALESSISALERDVSALESAVKALEISSACWEPWVWVFSALVVVGVVMELWVVRRDWREEWETFAIWYFVSVTRSPSRPSRLKLWIEVLSVVFIAIGVAGELGIGVKISLINGAIRGKAGELRSKNADLRSKSDQLVALLENAAEDERLARIQLEERVAWRTISPADIARIGSKLSVHRGIRIAVSTVAGNEEAVSFAGDVGAIFTTARWSFLGVVPMGNLGVQRFGLRIATTRDDLTRTAAQDLRKALDRLGFKPTYEESDQVFAGGGAGIYVSVELRPRVVPINKNPASSHK